MTPEASTRPLQPKVPEMPLFGGMNGCQFAVSM